MKLSAPCHDNLGNLIRTFRERRGVPQWELSKSLGLTSPQFISNIERGLCAVPMPTLKAICKKLKIPAKEVYKSIEGDLQNKLAQDLRIVRNAIRLKGEE